MTQFFSSLCSLCSLWSLFGCTGYGTPTPEALERVRRVAPPPGPFVDARASLEIESPWMSGRFEGIILARTGPRPEARAQFFPDLGGKAFDLTARPDRIAGRFPQAGESVDTARDGWRPHLATLMGATLLEVLAPVGPERVSGAREDPEGLWVGLKPVVEAIRSDALIGPAGGIVRRRFQWHFGPSWEIEIESGRRTSIRASRLELRLELLELRVVSSVPEGTFDFGPR